MAEVEALRPRLRQESLFAVVRISPAELPRHLPPRDGAYLADRFRRALGVADRLIPVILYQRVSPLDRAGIMQNFDAGGRSPFRRQCHADRDMTGVMRRKAGGRLRVNIVRRIMRHVRARLG